jgi:hypothetical protein
VYSVALRFKTSFPLQLINHVTFLNAYANPEKLPVLYIAYYIKDEFEDTNVVIRIRNSKKDRQHNAQKKKDNRTNNDLQKIHIKQKIE